MKIKGEYILIDIETGSGCGTISYLTEEKSVAKSGLFAFC